MESSLVALAGFLALAQSLILLALVIFWMVVGWRAMKAHENLASSHDDIRRELRRIGDTMRGEIPPKDPNYAAVDPAKLPRLKKQDF